MNFVSTENLRPSFRELTASTEKRRGGPLPPPLLEFLAMVHTTRALGSFPTTRLSARENAAVFNPRVIHHATDISIVVGHTAFRFDKHPAATLI